MDDIGFSIRTLQAIKQCKDGTIRRWARNIRILKRIRRLLGNKKETN